MGATAWERFSTARARTREIFSWVDPMAFDMQAIPVRHPLRFYEGHLAAFNARLLVTAGLFGDRTDADLITFFARGIDPASPEESQTLTPTYWPPRSQVSDLISRVDDAMVHTLAAGTTETHWMCIEHEEMHHESLIHLIHQLPYDLKKRLPTRPEVDAPAASPAWIDIPAGKARLGTPIPKPFRWDNEGPATDVYVPKFAIASHKTTNAEFLAFVDAGGYQRRELWSDAGWRALRQGNWTHPLFWIPSAGPRAGTWRYRNLFDETDLPLHAPALVSYFEAEAYAEWRSARLLTEAEFHRAAFGNAAPKLTHHHVGSAAFEELGFRPVSDARAPRSAEGVVELWGNGWEWTSTPFSPFPGFTPQAQYPGYSADFFDGDHVTVKGASPVTAHGLVRPGFRNWYRRNYRYAYTGFRCAK